MFQPSSEPTSAISAGSSSSIVNVGKDMFHGNSSVPGSAASSTMNSGTSNNRMLAPSLKFTAKTATKRAISSDQILAKRPVIQGQKLAAQPPSSDQTDITKIQLEERNRQFQSEHGKLTKSLDYYKRINHVRRQLLCFLRVSF